MNRPISERNPFFELGAGPSSSEARGLHARTDEELDVLSYGVIALDEHGTILRYNLAESRFARLDRAQVLGRNFFRDVAPCTTNDDFQGHVDRFLAPGNAESTFAFDFTFDFRFGAQLVQVELVRPPEPGMVYICVARREAMPRRQGVPSEQLAVAQTDLAHSEARLGVRRDTFARRRLDVSPVLLASAATAIRAFEEIDAERFFYQWGHAWGRRTAVELHARSLEHHAAMLDELTMDEALEAVVGYLMREGWGRLRADFTAARLGYFIMEVERNALAETADGREAGRAMMGGFLSAVCSHLAGRMVATVPLDEAAEGSTTFVLGATERFEELQAAVRAADGSRERLANIVSAQIRGEGA